MIGGQLHPAQVHIIDEGIGLYRGDAVLVQYHIFKAGWQWERAQVLDAVTTGVQGGQIEAVTQTVVVTELLNGVAVQVQPLEVFGNEGVIEPLQMIRGHIEPFKVWQRWYNAVDVF